MAKMLLVEDDPILGKGLQVSLSTESYDVEWVQTLRAAREANTRSMFDLVILDLNLPDGSGFDLCDELRKSGSRIPIIMLTAKSDEDSVVRGLSIGANDYVRKPFSQKELLARVKVAIREPLIRENQIRLGPILILEGQRKFLIDGTEVNLNRREFDILCYLAKNPGAVISRESILEALNSGGDLNDRTIDSHLSHIRSKLKKSSIEKVGIQSVYGVGYKLEYS